jgi:c-di-GMP-binding flagellar brake protein YcgR
MAGLGERLLGRCGDSNRVFVILKVNDRHSDICEVVYVRSDAIQVASSGAHYRRIAAINAEQVASYVFSSMFEQREKRVISLLCRTDTLQRL